MDTKRLRAMVYEIFKTLNNLNPVFMKDIFHHYSPHVTHKKHNLYIHTQNTTKFGNKKLRSFGTNMWNTLPEYIKDTEATCVQIATEMRSCSRLKEMSNVNVL